MNHLSQVCAADLASSTAWQPRGILVAHLAEHRRAINHIAVARSAAFFMTASDDETCKIWDSRRLEKDISFRSKLTYASQVQRSTCSASVQEVAIQKNCKIWGLGCLVKDARLKVT